MSRFIVIFFCLALFSGQTVVASAAQQDTLQVARAAVDSLLKDTAADTLAVPDSISDEELLKSLLAPQSADTVAKVKDKGFDVSKMIHARRVRAADVTPFESKPFMKNTFATLRMTSLTMANDDYSSGLQAGLSFGKWLTPDHAVRINLESGLWNDNFDVEPVLGSELSASYIFNLTSYAFGYRTNRLFEVSLLGGLGIANSILTQHRPGQTGSMSGTALTAHVGTHLNLRVFKNLDFFLEPQAVIYTNGMAVSNAGNWRSVLAAFRGTFGLTYNLQQSYHGDSPLLLDRSNGYFVSLMMGPSYQNSRLVYETVGLARALGVQVALSVGKYYTDYFAVRYSGGYTRGTWVAYKEETYNCNYFSARAEGMFDVVRFVQRLVAGGTPEKVSAFSGSILFGPEIGYMYKMDMKDVIQTLYMGMSGGIQAKCHVNKRLSLFVEPRFSIIPYDAPANDPTTLNDHRNYWDAVINLNAGIEFTL